MTIDSPSTPAISVSRNCKNCSKKFTYTKTSKGGKPQLHCSNECAKKYADRNRSYRIVEEHIKLQSSYFRCEGYLARQAFLKALFIRYARAIAGLPRNKLTANQIRALTNSFLFKSSGQDQGLAIDPLTGTKVKNIHLTFMAYCHEIEHVDPHDHYKVVKKAGLFEECQHHGIQLPAMRPILQSRAGRTTKIYSNKRDNVVSYEVRKTAKQAAKARSAVQMDEPRETYQEAPVAASSFTVAPIMPVRKEPTAPAASAPVEYRPASVAEVIPMKIATAPTDVIFDQETIRNYALDFFAFGKSERLTPYEWINKNKHPWNLAKEIDGFCKRMTVAEWDAFHDEVAKRQAASQPVKYEFEAVLTPVIIREWKDKHKTVSPADIKLAVRIGIFPDDVTSPDQILPRCEAMIAAGNKVAVNALAAYNNGA